MSATAVERGFTVSCTPGSAIAWKKPEAPPATGLLEMAYPFEFPRSLSIYILGTGGNGSYLVEHVSRLASTLLGSRSHKIIVVDGDEVEPKNVGRQKFVLADTGRNKADVLAERYAMAFGVQIQSYPAFIEDSEELRKLIQATRDGMPLIVGCVDNNRTRQIIYELFTGRLAGETLWLDAGNEEWAGQVVLGANYLTALPTMDKLDAFKPAKFRLPSICDLYPDVRNDLTSKTPGQMSCAERAVSNPQSVATNVMASTALFGFLNILMAGDPTKGIRHHAAKFNARLNSMTPRMNTLRNLTSIDPTIW